jgi:uncharacterized OsmC-like protein
MTDQRSNVASRQAPLRRVYTEYRGQAITVKQVRTVETDATDAWHGIIEADDYPGLQWDYGIDAKVGGYDDLPNPGHILCAALAGCLDSTVRMIADHLSVRIEHLEVDVVGEVDVRGCLAMDSTVRPGFQQLRCEIRLQPASGADERLVRILLNQTEKLCVTLDTLRNGVPIDVETRVGAPSGADA